MTDDVPAEVRLGAEAHYQDADYYDRAYRRRREDVRFYADLAETHGGPVLELGCGTGRVTRAIADRGVDIVGVDNMPPMLARARERVSKPKRVQRCVELLQGDLRSVRLERRFELVIAPFNVLMHLYSRQDIERALGTVRAHLSPKGRFVFDVRVPDSRELSRNPNKVYKAGQVTREGRRYHYRERFDYDPITQIQTVEMAFVGVDDPSDFHLTPLTHRMFFPQELEALLHYNGLDVLDVYGDFEGEALDETHDSQVVACSAR